MKLSTRLFYETLKAVPALWLGIALSTDQYKITDIWFWVILLGCVISLIGRDTVVMTIYKIEESEANKQHE